MVYVIKTSVQIANCLLKTNVPEEPNNIGACGCNAGRRAVEPQVTPIPQQQGVQRDNLQGTAPKLLGTQQMTINQQKAENIRNKLENMKEVQNVNIIVMGNTALVGYKPSTNKGDTNSTNKMIQNKVMNIDKTITNVIATQSSDIVNRITTLSKDITDNTPVNDIINEFNRIIRSINPTT